MKTKDKSMEYFSIKNWAEDDKPREKLMNKGREALSNAELLAILIGSGPIGSSALAVGQDLLKKAQNNLNVLSRQSLKELKNINGIGDAKGITIMAALELGRRRQKEGVVDRKQITSSADGFNYFQPHIGDLPYEEFWVLFLNRQNKILSGEKISQGGVAGTVADLKIIFKSALEKLACSIIVAHNHPSGNLRPSESDKKLTKKIVEAGKIIDIKVLDHLIVTDGGYYSFADEGML